MTPAPPNGADRPTSRFGSAMLWLWRLANTALLASAVWVLWQQTLEMSALNDQLSSLLDYLSVIAESVH
jgi:hypothetical protein